MLIGGNLRLGKLIMGWIQSLRNWSIWLVYLSFGVSLVFSMIYLGNFLDVRFFTLMDRGMIEQSVSSSFFLPPGTRRFGVLHYLRFWFLRSIG